MIRTAFRFYYLYIFFSYINLVRFYLHQLLSDRKLFVFYTLEQKQYDIYISIYYVISFFTSFIDIEPPMLKCCGCQTNFILSLGGSFLFSKNFFTDPQFNWGFSHAYSAYNKKLLAHMYMLAVTLL